MPIFRYKAINDSGATVSGTIEADSVDGVNAILVGRGLIPSRVVDHQYANPLSNVSAFLQRFRSVQSEELILFTKQFRTMVRAGVPMMTLLQTLESQTEDPLLKKIINHLTQDIREGLSLHDAFRKHPKVFPPLYCRHGARRGSQRCVAGGAGAIDLYHGARA